MRKLTSNHTYVPTARVHLGLRDSQQEGYFKIIYKQVCHSLDLDCIPTSYVLALLAAMILLGGGRTFRRLDIVERS
jgi:hypothetical protein